MVMGLSLKYGFEYYYHAILTLIIVPSLGNSISNDVQQRIDRPFILLIACAYPPE